MIKIILCPLNTHSVETRNTRSKLGDATMQIGADDYLPRPFAVGA